MVLIALLLLVLSNFGKLASAEPGLMLAATTLLAAAGGLWLRTDQYSPFAAARRRNADLELRCRADEYRQREHAFRAEALFTAFTHDAPPATFRYRVVFDWRVADFMVAARHGALDRAHHEWIRAVVENECIAPSLASGAVRFFLNASSLGTRVMPYVRIGDEVRADLSCRSVVAALNAHIGREISGRLFGFEVCIVSFTLDQNFNASIAANPPATAQCALPAPGDARAVSVPSKRKSDTPPAPRVEQYRPHRSGDLILHTWIEQIRDWTLLRIDWHRDFPGGRVEVYVRRNAPPVAADMKESSVDMSGSLRHPVAPGDLVYIRCDIKGGEEFMHTLFVERESEKPAPALPAPAGQAQSLPFVTPAPTDRVVRDRTAKGGKKGEKDPLTV